MSAQNGKYFSISQTTPVLPSRLWLKRRFSKKRALIYLGMMDRGAVHSYLKGKNMISRIYGCFALERTRAGSHWRTQATLERIAGMKFGTSRPGVKLIELVGRFSGLPGST